MQEPQQTPIDNTFFDLVSVLYHALEEAQTSSTYIQDAQQHGRQDLAHFFQQVQQQANDRAERARQLLSQLGRSQMGQVGNQSTVSTTGQYAINNPDIPGGASF